MGVCANIENNRHFDVCLKKFFCYLFKQFVAILLAPALAFFISAFAMALTDLTLLNLGDIFENCFENCIYGDILLSILSVYVILFWEYIVVYKDDAETYLKRCLWLIKSLKGLGFILFFLLFAVAIIYKYYGSVSSRCVVLFNIVEALGFSVCIILQCISHPKEYMTTRSKH